MLSTCICTDNSPGVASLFLGVLARKTPKPGRSYPARCCTRAQSRLPQPAASVPMAVQVETITTSTFGFAVPSCICELAGPCVMRECKLRYVHHVNNTQTRSRAEIFGGCGAFASGIMLQTQMVTHT